MKVLLAETNLANHIMHLTSPQTRNLKDLTTLTAIVSSSEVQQELCFTTQWKEALTENSI